MWGSGGIALPFLTSVLGVGEWSASRPGRFTPGEEPQYPLDRRLGGPQSRSGRCGEEKNLLPLPGIETRLSSLSLYRPSYPGLLCLVLPIPVYMNWYFHLFDSLPGCFVHSGLLSSSFRGIHSCRMYFLPHVHVSFLRQPVTSRMKSVAADSVLVMLFLE
jgi:hypothetical protein